METARTSMGVSGADRMGNAMMRKLLISCAVIAAAVSVGAGPASAKQPVVKGCVGESVSSNAKADGPYGAFISFIASDGGLGDDVQLVQAGLIPDEAYENTCND